MEQKGFADLVRDVCDAFVKVEQSFIEFDIAMTLMNNRAASLGIMTKENRDEANAAMETLRDTIKMFEPYREKVEDMRQKANQFEEMINDHASKT